MDEKITKILQLIEGMQELKNSILNYEEAKKQVSVLLMNEVFGSSINEGMKVSLLKVVSSILFDTNTKLQFSKDVHEWTTLYSISADKNKIFFDIDKNFVQIKEHIIDEQKEGHVLYKCSNNIMIRTDFSTQEKAIIVYDDIGLEKSKTVRGVSVPDNISYEEHFLRDDNDLTTVFFAETFDNEESFSTTVRKVSKIYELDTGVNYVYQGSENDLDGIIATVKENLEKEDIYKYFPALKNKILNRLSTQFTIEVEGNKTM